MGTPSMLDISGSMVLMPRDVVDRLVSMRMVLDSKLSDGPAELPLRGTAS
jgi:hypothetical protein